MNHEGIMKKLSKKGFIILLAILAAIILITVVVVLFIIFGGKKEIVVPPNAIGNSAGNLQNGGLFCEYDDYGRRRHRILQRLCWRYRGL